MLQILDTERRNMVLALQVEHLRSKEGGSLSWEGAIQELAQRKGMSASAIRDAYKPYRQRAKEAYKRLRTVAADNR